jgi:signal transduction histidine kinase/ligand-binding sensor domain-containing protein/DNA-binding response OmpR family regulator
VLLLSVPAQFFPQVSKIRTFEHFNVDHGMPSNIAQCIIQDKEGYLWFGMYAGIARYDGYNFTSYINEPGNPNSINSGTIQALCEDKDGFLWIGSSLGLDKFEPATGTFTHYFPNPLAEGTDFSNHVLSICEDKYGMLWIGTADGLYRFDKETKSFTSFKNNPADSSSIRNNYVSAILEERDGTLWIGTGNGLDKLDRETDTFVHHWHDPDNTTVSPVIEWNQAVKYHVSYQINSIYEDRSGALWLCTNGEGLIEFNKNDETYTAYQRNANDPKSLTNNRVTSICEDNEGTFWIGTEFGGVNIFDKQANTFSHYERNEFDPGSLSHNLVLSVLCERSGSIWIGTFIGVNKLNRTRQPFVQYNKLEGSWDQSLGTAGNFITGAHNLVWLTPDNGTLRFNPQDGTFTLEPFALMPAGDTTCIWMFPLSSSDGIYTRDRRGQFSRIRYSTGQEFNQPISCYYRDPSSDTTWVGTVEGGIFSFDKNTKTISPFDSLNTSIKCIYKDSFGLLWIGTKDAGLIQYGIEQRTPTRFRSIIDDPTSISADFVTAMVEDSESNMWFGTNNGLNKYIRSTNSFVHYTEKNGLANNWIFALEIDDAGNVWFGTNYGITKLNPKTGVVRNYDKSYGLATNRFAFTSYKTDNGEMFFTGPGGLTRFHPDSIKDNPYIPPIVITSFRVFDKPIPFGKEIELPYDKNFLSFEFAALSYLSPERNQYAYQLEGVDEDWVYSGTRHFATYPNLAPGNYTFKVKGSNNDGVWNEAGTSVTIVISPPWWRSTGAYILYVIILVFILYGFRRYELNRVKLKNKIKLDEVVLKERVETDKMKSRFFANISHEFRTPLTLILGPAEKINSQTSNDIIKDSGIIKRNSKRLLQLVNQLLDLSRLEAGKLKLQASKVNIVSFVRGLTMSFESLAERKDIKLNVTAEMNDIELYFDRDKMAKILANLLSNAFKFTGEGGTIEVRIELPTPRPSKGGDNPSFKVPSPGGDLGVGLKEDYAKKFVSISVRDTGIGISEEELPKLFDRFYQVDSSQTREHEGTGIGLALTKELVELHKGNIRVKSKVGQGSEFIVELPLGREHLRDDEINEASEEESVVILSPEGEKNLFEVVSEETIDSSSSFDRLRTPQNDSEEEQEKTIILVVEDNADVREFIKDSLGSEFQIEEASNGEQGVNKACEIIPDLIISDIMMPKMDGNELTKILKNDEKTSHIPVILLTAKSEQESKLEGLETGADDYLTKPFDTKELLIRIKNLINIRRKLQEKFSGEKIIARKVEKKLSSLDEKFLTIVLEVAEKHLSEEEFSIEEFGNEVGMGRVQLHRKLKALTGKSPSLYLRSVRLAKAKKMIEERTGNISEIAYSTGFSSPAYFTACFKEEFGYPPSEIERFK